MIVERAVARCGSQSWLVAFFAGPAALRVTCLWPLGAAFLATDFLLAVTVVGATYGPGAETVGLAGGSTFGAAVYLVGSSSVRNPRTTIDHSGGGGKQVRSWPPQGRAG
jgi:hypothetical protein